MADKVYRLKDVPKGQKLQYFFDYYKVHLAVAAFIIAFIIIGVYELTHVPNFDLKITLFGENMKVSENALKSLEYELEQMNLDLNEDGKVDIGITPLIKTVGENGASGEFNEVAFAELSIGDSVIMITDEAILNSFLKPRGVIINCEQAGIEGEGFVEIPYENTLFNDYIDESLFEREMFVVLKQGKPVDDAYLKQIDIFKKVFLK